MANHGLPAAADSLRASRKRATVAMVSASESLSPFVIRAATAEDLTQLPALELAAGVGFAEIGMDEVAADEPPTAEELAPYQADGRCWIAVGADRPNVVVAYLIVDRVDGCCHIEQVSVHPDAAGHRLGQALIDRAEAWAVADGCAALTLATFVTVPWNGPYYERLGFRFLDPAEETAGLRAIRAEERAAGLDRWPRACMRRELRSNPAD